MNVRIYNHNISPFLPLAARNFTTRLIYAATKKRLKTALLAEKAFKLLLFFFVFGKIYVVVNILNVVVIFECVEHFLEGNRLVGV